MMAAVTAVVLAVVMAGPTAAAADPIPQADCQEDLEEASKVGEKGKGNEVLFSDHRLAQ